MMTINILSAIVAFVLAWPMQFIILGIIVAAIVAVLFFGA